MTCCLLLRKNFLAYSQVDIMMAQAGMTLARRGTKPEKRPRTPCCQQMCCSISHVDREALVLSRGGGRQKTVIRQGKQLKEKVQWKNCGIWQLQTEGTQSSVIKHGEWLRKQVKRRKVYQVSYRHKTVKHSLLRCDRPKELYHESTQTFPTQHN